MVSRKLLELISEAGRVFVWVQVTPEHAAYFQIQKSPLFEYLCSEEAERYLLEHLPLVEVDEFGDVFIGKPQSESDSSDSS